MSWASSAVTPIARRMPATMPGACLGFGALLPQPDCIVRTVIPRTNSKAKSGATSCRRPVAAARRMSSLSRSSACDTRDIWHRGGAACDERAPGGVVQCLIDEGSAAGGNALDRIIKRQSGGVATSRQIHVPISSAKMLCRSSRSR